MSTTRERAVDVEAGQVDHAQPDAIVRRAGQN